LSDARRLPGGVVNAAGGHLPVLSGCGCGVSAEDFGSWRRAALCPDQTIRPKCWGSKFMEPSDARRASEAAQGPLLTQPSETVIGPSKPMNQSTHPEELPAEVLDDVASVVGAEVTLLSRLPGGVNAGAMRVQLAGRANAVLKAVPRAHPNHLDETLRAQRVVEHMRRRGYPTPAWLGVGATATHVWHLMDFVDAAPAPELTQSLVEQLMEIIELQAGQASEPYDHWSYAWRVATGQESAVAGLDFNETPEQSLLRQSVARLSGYSSVVSALVERLRLVCADVKPPREAPDMVHTDLNPSNVLVRDGAVAAVVDIGNAGSGTRATDLTNLVWNTFQDPLDGVRRRLWTRILVLVGWEGAAVLAATQILLMLEVPIRHGRHDVVPGVVKRGHRALDELIALR
jgi:hypothetical protein